MSGLSSHIKYCSDNLGRIKMGGGQETGREEIDDR